ncbi:MAG: hypothetical protein HYR85_14220 [Planctomycetes bacterium]|nr:hypothetical protein [Planctomycetota bacterium]
MDIVISETPNVVLQFVDTTAAPVSGVRIGLGRSDVPIPFSVDGRSEADGVCRIWAPEGAFGMGFSESRWKRMEGDPPAAVEGGMRLLVPPVGVLARTIVIVEREVFTVRVIDATTKAPIEEFALLVSPARPVKPLMHVALDPSMLRGSRPGGATTYPLLCSGPFPVQRIVSVKAPGYRQKDVDAFVSPGDEVDVALERTKPLRVRVLSETSARLSGIAVRVRALANDSGAILMAAGLVDSGTTDSNGLFESTGWEEGVAGIEVADERQFFVRPVTVMLPAPSDEIVVRLDRRSAVEGHILGDHPEAADLVLVNSAGHALPAVQRGAAYRVDRVPPGSYRLASRSMLKRWIYSIDSQIEVGIPVEVHAGAVTTVDVPWQSAATSRVTGVVEGLDSTRHHWITLVPPPARTPKPREPLRAFFVDNEARSIIGSHGDFVLEGVTTGEWIACVLTEVAGSRSLSLCEPVTVRVGEPLRLTWMPGYLVRAPESKATMSSLKWKSSPQLFWYVWEDLGPRVPLAPGVYECWSTLGPDGDVDIVAGRSTVLR